MRRAAILLLLASWPAFAAPRRPAPLDTALIGEVTAAALDFMAPRTLQAVPVPTMALWGLQGLGALDPFLVPSLAAGGLTGPKQVVALHLRTTPLHLLLAQAAPPEADMAGWGTTIAAMTQAGWAASPALRAAGTQRILDAFFAELFSHFDPYSRYEPPAEAQADRARRFGEAGVGLGVAHVGGGFAVTSVQAGSPAAEGGVRAGDLILAIDGQSTQQSDLGAINTLLSGPQDSQVALTLRAPHGPARTVTLTRVLIPPETVTARRAGRMLVLRISSFSQDTASRLAQELIRGLGGGPDAPPEGVVIDLRGNRGGVLQQSVAAVAMLQGTGIVAQTEGRDPRAGHVFLANGRDLAEGLPVVVLVDGNTASAAEIMAAALADQRRAVVVGSATLGKGLVQTVVTLPDAGELFVTWSRVLAPLGWPIQGLGVLPQVCTSLGPQVLARELHALADGRQLAQLALTAARAARAPLAPARALAIRDTCPSASGRDADLGAARFLIDTPRAYQQALLRIGGGQDGLTPPPPIPH